MKGARLHLALFLLTVVTTLYAGAYYIQDYDIFVDFPHRLLTGLWKGVPFSLPLLAILGSHEFAHYFNSKRHHVDATLPYFIPFPNIFGTLGAVIKMRSRIMDRRALIDIGASGPLAGFVLAVLACAAGITLSTVGQEVPLKEGDITLGGSLLFDLMLKVFLDADIADKSVNLHPIAVAGWVGLFVTSINLMPVGQLDGGHISYAFLGTRHRYVSWAFIVLLVLMGAFFFEGWLIWAALLIVLGTKHPPVADPYSPLDTKRKLIGLASLAVFILTFSPSPIDVYIP
ncbi:MAG: site-2 protease family protein [Nitrospirae bacterium]|nr:site-2 protease family protein [Nitrospirota bacterium]MBI5694848.1 site-2 protease family protein [Nitrospirota bacterium]